MAEQMHPQLRKRILMFYFAAGIQLVMAVIVVSIGAAVLSGVVIAIVVVVCLVFAYVNYKFAKSLTRQYEAAVRERGLAKGVNE